MASLPRELVVGRRWANRPLVEVLRSYFRLSPGQVRELWRGHGILVGGKACQDLTRLVRAGEHLELKAPRRQRGRAGREALPPLARKIRILFEDDQVVVVDKPAGLTTVRHASETAEFGARARRFLPETLVDCLTAKLAGQGQRGRLRAVHRLDKETSGVVVLALTPQAERHLGKQFRAHATERTYLALVRGWAEAGRIESFLVRDRGDGRRGSAAAGQRAVTHVRVVDRLGPCTLVECRLETGRTHQVRVHLGEAGTPLCGESVYDRPLHGKPLPDPSNAKRLMLHAATLAFAHPTTGQRLSFRAPMPADMKALVDRLRARHER